MTTALVTGANRGIGLELCRKLQAAGSEVLAACRNSSPELERLNVRVFTGIDVTSDASVEQLRRELTSRPIDILINSAGVLMRDTLETLDLAQARQQIEVNALGPVRVTRALWANLRQNSKIAMVTSRMGSIGDNASGGYYGYRMSKAALNAAGRSLALDLKPRGIAVAILHPGYVRTDMTQNQGNVEPEQAAEQLLERVAELTLENSGRFLHANGQELPW